MKLEEAERLAQDFIEEIRPFCERIQVAGSVRRKRPEVKDVDLVMIVRDWFGLNATLQKLGKLVLDGPKVKRILYKGAQIDMYVATPKTWATLLLIRTGSVDHNIRLCTIARSKGMHLSASGDGLFDQEGKRIAGDNEESIYEALGLEYEKPEERD
jgi:DNA polymerase (family 10)